MSRSNLVIVQALGRKFAAIIPSNKSLDRFDGTVALLQNEDKTELLSIILIDRDHAHDTLEQLLEGHIGMFFEENVEHLKENTEGYGLPTWELGDEGWVRQPPVPSECCGIRFDVGSVDEVSASLDLLP